MEAFTNYFSTHDPSVSENNRANRESGHYTFINSQILPLTIKLQREMRGRKYKELQKKLKATVQELKRFQNETWPKPPGAYENSARNHDENDDFDIGDPKQGFNQNEQDADEATQGEVEMEMQMDFSFHSNLPEEKYSHMLDIPDDMSVKPENAEDQNLHDDPNTREVVHDAVLGALEAYMFALSHPNKTSKATESALECVYLFVSKRYVSGRAGGQDDQSGSGAKTLELWQQQVIDKLPPPSLLHQLMESVAKCSESSSETIQNGLVRTMLAILTSPKCGVHEASMLLALRSTFHVYLVTKSSNVKESAKFALMDMIRCVFGRMEAYHIMLNTAEEETTVLTTTTEGGSTATSTTSTLGSGATPNIHDRALPAGAQTPPQSLSFTSVTNEDDLTASASQFHTDSYVLFRSLCKLSSKELPQDQGQEIHGGSGLFHSNTWDPMALKNKILSLELILSVMELCGDAFCQGEKFIYLVQRYLCVSLLKNCMSHHTQVAFLSQKIFLILVYKFKGNLKQEIEVFMSNIFLRVLESQNSSFPQKALVLESLRSLCRDPVLLTQIFLNYDCDFDAMNLYKDIVLNLTKLSGKSISLLSAASVSHSNMSKKEIDEQYELSLAGVEVLVTILKAFLKALGLPGGGDEGMNDDDTAGAKIRGMLQLDVGLAARPDHTVYPSTNTSTHGQGLQRTMSSHSLMSTAAKSDDMDGMDSSSQIQQQIFSSSMNSVQQQSQNTVTESSKAAGKIVDAFDRKRNAEQNFEIGVVKFTLSLKSGLKFFVDNGFVDCNAKDVAHFFLSNKDKLDKTQIGEALGREPDAAFIKSVEESETGGPGFWFNILYHYIDAMNFSGMVFDEAIRLFLSGFRLPGEAQKIDRIMEKFAARYILQNDNVFPLADTAFILAFSVIMLNTDLHNPSIKPERRMTCESFIRNNRGIAINGGDLPDEFLRGIYERIKKGPFSLKEDDVARDRQKTIESSFKMTNTFLDGATGSGIFGGMSTDERKRERFKVEREEMMAATAQLIRRKQQQQTTNSLGTSVRSLSPNDIEDTSRLTDSVAPADVVKPMFDVTWGPVIGILSQVLECCDDDRSIAVCLNGFVYAIRLASHSNMSLARDTFVTSLAKFTFLGSIKEMKRKNIESIRTLLSIAVIDGEYLGESWGPVLQCISQLARLRMSACGLDSDESFLLDTSYGNDKNGNFNNGQNNNHATSKRNAHHSQSHVERITDSGAALFRNQSRVEIARETEESNGRFVLQAVNEVLIDKVFSSTVNLSAQSLAHFIEQLVAVSEAEIAGTLKSGITGINSLSNTNDDSVSGGTTSERHSTIVKQQNLSIAQAQQMNADGPSIFSLQRIVEVADYNMDVRPRLVWAQLWERIAAYFATVGSHDNVMVSVFAIDSLKQLSFKFLDKPELSEFNFQRIFLSPFLRFLEDDRTREEIRELVLRCLDNIVRTKSHNLRSGWKIIYNILARAANDPSDNIKFLGVAILQRLLDEHLHQLCRLSDGSVSHGNHLESSSSHECSEEEKVVHDEDEQQKKQSKSSYDSRTRNTDAEDFVGLCRASLSFVQREETDSPRPSGLSMRGLCHTAIYADILADQRVRRPKSGAQWSNPNAPGYTYEGLNEEESLDMVLWRHLLEGLAEGIRSPARSSTALGVGCVVQRGSLLALRSILLRHGHIFSIEQWEAILKQTILPIIQSAAESDDTPVIGITSESPSVSSIDFLASSLPLPPPPDDKGLKKFEVYASSDSNNSEPRRPYGISELLLEASFTDMRHGGDGDVSRAYLFAKKDIKPQVIEQPFPTSWIATTSQIALGMVTDIASEIIINRGLEGRTKLWPIIADQYKLWCVGHASWKPCESLVRVACNEMHRFTDRVVKILPDLHENNKDEEAISWTSTLLSCYSDALSESLAYERKLQDFLNKKKNPEYRGEYSRSGTLKMQVLGKSENFISEVVTPYGEGVLLQERDDLYEDSNFESIEVTTRVIELEYGALLYYSELKEGDDKSNSDITYKNYSSNNSSSSTTPDEMECVDWLDIVPAMKIRCVAAHCLQYSILETLDGFLRWVSKPDISQLVSSLSFSRQISEEAICDEIIKYAFEEAFFSEWGDGVEEVERALSSVSKLPHVRGSEMFYMIQEASATNAIIYILNILFENENDGEMNAIEWDRQTYAEPLLIQTIKNVLYKFLDSEEKDGHLIDPNVWKSIGESGTKTPVYCTTFAAMIVFILEMMLSLTQDLFDRHKEDFFPIICSLIRVQSEEIRVLVQRILLEKISPMIGLEVPEFELVQFDGSNSQLKFF